VDQVTLRSSRQLQSPELARKGKEKETLPEESSLLANAKEQSEERAIPSNSKRRGSSNDVGVTKEPKQNLSTTTPFQIHQGSHKDRVRYDVISHLKRIPARLSIYNALQMSKELRKALIQALMDPDDYKDQVNPIEVDEVLSSPLIRCAACMACITFTDEDMQLGSTNHNKPLYVISPQAHGGVVAFQVRSHRD